MIGPGGRPAPGPYSTEAFDYPLPAHLIARYPAARREDSRLLVLRRPDATIEHGRFPDLLELVAPGDAVVLNDTRVIPARLVGRKATGAPGEVLLIRPWSGAGADPYVWEALVRPGGKLKPGRVLDIAPGLAVRVLDSTPDGGRVVRLETKLAVEEALERYGRTPLPPYLGREPEELDRDRYQTVYARHPGSVAAPTAGLHFTRSMLDGLERRGCAVVRVLLHVGVGTFRPVETKDPELHRMHAEWYEVDDDAAATLRGVRDSGGSIWAVGTTVVRALETVAAGGAIRAGRGWTTAFLRPGHEFRAVDRLVTNFHLPRSTLLMLVAAFGGYEAVMAAYREAVERGYRFYSYGDAMAVL